MTFIFILFLQNTLEGEQEVKCSFCDEKYPSLAIGDHLLLCGNKTEQCPNCEKYIRRAVFAYHYENKCEDFLESMRQPSSNPKKPILSKFPFNIRFFIRYKFLSRFTEIRTSNYDM